jgi:hypothetical protein
LSFEFNLEFVFEFVAAACFFFSGGRFGFVFDFVLDLFLILFLTLFLNRFFRSGGLQIASF